MRYISIVLGIVLSTGISLYAQDPLAARLDRAIRAAGAAARPSWTIQGVSIGDPANKATWKVRPPTRQQAAQPTIDAFDPADPAHARAELDAQAVSALDAERLTSAVIWTILKQMFPSDTDAQTKTKYGAVRTRIIGAYTARPWLP